MIIREKKKKKEGHQGGRTGRGRGEEGQKIELLYEN